MKTVFEYNTLLTVLPNSIVSQKILLSYRIQYNEDKYTYSSTAAMRSFYNFFEYMFVV